jgi:hypothetical protein
MRGIRSRNAELLASCELLAGSYDSCLCALYVDGSESARVRVLNHIIVLVLDLTGTILEVGHCEMLLLVTIRDSTSVPRDDEGA